MTLVFFGMLAACAAAVWAAGEWKRRRLRQQQADAQFLLHSSMTGAVIDDGGPYRQDNASHDYAPHQDF